MIMVVLLASRVIVILVMVMCRRLLVRSGESPRAYTCIAKRRKNSIFRSEHTIELDPHCPRKNGFGFEHA